MINWPATIVLSLIAISIRVFFRMQRDKQRAQLEAPRDYGGEEAASRRARARMRPVAVDELPAGNTGQLVQVTGTVAAMDELPLVSPLGGVPCVGYAVRATVWQSKKADHLIGEVKEAKAAAFVLSVGTSSLAIPADVDITLKGTDIKPAAERVEAFLAPKKMSAYAAFTDFTEIAIKPGDVVSVIGQVFHENAETGYRDGATHARLIVHLSGPMSIAPPPKSKR